MFDYRDEVINIIKEKSKVDLSKETIENITKIFENYYNDTLDHKKDSKIVVLSKLIKVLGADIKSYTKCYELSGILYKNVADLFIDKLEECMCAGAFGSFTPEHMISLASSGPKNIPNELTKPKSSVKPSTSGYTYANPSDYRLSESEENEEVENIPSIQDLPSADVLDIKRFCYNFIETQLFDRDFEFSSKELDGQKTYLFSKENASGEIKVSEKEGKLEIETISYSGDQKKVNTNSVSTKGGIKKVISLYFEKSRIKESRSDYVVQMPYDINKDSFDFTLFENEKLENEIPPVLVGRARKAFEEKYPNGLKGVDVEVIIVLDPEDLRLLLTIKDPIYTQGYNAKGNFAGKSYSFDKYKIFAKTMLIFDSIEDARSHGWNI